MRHVDKAWGAAGEAGRRRERHRHHREGAVPGRPPGPGWRPAMSERVMGDIKHRTVETNEAIAREEEVERAPHKL
jgi:hypothetical protein